MATSPTSPHFSPHALISRVRHETCGFLSQADVKALAEHPGARLWPLLVRCGGGRFTCPAQDVAHFVTIIQHTLACDELGGGGASVDYVRDVSLLAGYSYGGTQPWPTPDPCGGAAK